MSEEYGNTTRESTMMEKGPALQGTEPETDAPEIEIDTDALVAELDGSGSGDDPPDDAEDKELERLLALYPGAKKYYYPTYQPPLPEIMESWWLVHDAALTTLDLIYDDLPDSERAHAALYALRHAMKEQSGDLQDIIGLAGALHNRGTGSGPSLRLAAR